MIDNRYLLVLCATNLGMHPSFAHWQSFALVFAHHSGLMPISDITHVYTVSANIHIYNLQRDKIDYFITL